MSIEMTASAGVWKKVVEALKVHATVVDLAAESGTESGLDQRRRSERIRSLANQLSIELDSEKNRRKVEAEERDRRRYRPEDATIALRRKD